MGYRAEGVGVTPAVNISSTDVILNTICHGTTVLGCWLGRWAGEWGIHFKIRTLCFYYCEWHGSGRAVQLCPPQIIADSSKTSFWRLGLMSNSSCLLFSWVKLSTYSYISRCIINIIVVNKINSLFWWQMPLFLSTFKWFSLSQVIVRCGSVCL